MEEDNCNLVDHVMIIKIELDLSFALICVLSSPLDVFAPMYEGKCGTYTLDNIIFPRIFINVLFEFIDFHSPEKLRLS